MDLDEPLNPAQEEVLALLRAPGVTRPEYGEDLRGELRAELEARLSPVVEHLGDKRLVVTKHGLTTVHGCEAHHLASQGTFAWSVTTARGSVAHKAVELWVHWRGQPHPAEVVDEALARLTEADHEPGPWLQARTQADLAELRGAATEVVTKFVECFPPLRTAWRPLTESRLTLDLLDDRVRLAGKVDLTLGAPQGRRAGKVIVDLKTGHPNPTHRDDLRYYALVEAVRLGVPPFRVASYYLDSGRAVVEDVTPDLLHAAVRRVAEGARLMVELERAARTPLRRAGPSCWWCPLQEDCPEAAAWAEQADR